jgi:aryl-alcohol dehydrogenase-like predicted oxidoreductase
MKYSRLGSSGLIVSKYCYGAANVGTPLPQFAVTPHLNEAATREAVAVALDHGVNFFDTADLYSEGEAEEILGRALAARRQEVVISTKVGLRTGPAATSAGLSRRHILASVDACLRRLGTDWIDVYIAHRTDPHTPLEETLEAFDQVVRAGKVRYLGYSNWPDWLAAKAVTLQQQSGWARFVTAQMYYSLIGRELEHSTIPFCLDAGIGLMTWSPTAGGFLSGKYTRENPQGDGGRLTKFAFVPIDNERAHATLDVVRQVAARLNATPACIAMAWLTQQAAVSTVMLGISRVSMMAENLKAASVVLGERDLQELASVSQLPEPYPNWYNTMMTDIVTRDALG